MPLRRSWANSVTSSFPTDYVTLFPAAESPLREGQIWTNGLADGLLWQDNITDGSGLAFGTGTSSGFTDGISTIQNKFVGTKHYGFWRYHLQAGYTPTDSDEVELLLGFTISANNAKGYEMDFGFGTSLIPVRWNGGSGDFTTSVFTTTSGAAFSVADGDIVLGRFDSTSGNAVISLWLNPSGATPAAQMLNTPSVVYTDSTAGKILTGNPGFGTFVRPQAGFDMKKLCINKFGAGNA